MRACSSCSRDIPPDSALCPYCGVALQTLIATTTQPSIREHHSAPIGPGRGGSSLDSIDDSRFVPGTLLADRFRIVGLLGRGGMGEVYRADDLKLRQPVALKFLPGALTKDARRLERFHHEVRIARHVSHPNVCRVYDIAEAQGQHFLSMEYVDGEDLSAVFRRMGRPSKEKALEIARQLCAGLAAAHDKGVLHRDLKPHNVIIDGTGRVRITDFGLAGFAKDFTGAEIRVGTPAYMAPEQLEGREVSVKSDIYSLGLVLFELFTGQRAFEDVTTAELRRTRVSATPTSLSSLAEDIDPAVERVILRCIDPEPSARPSSALAVAAALPGGDPLAAALAAGETPSPTMVANAGEVGGLRPAIAVLCLLAIIAGILAHVMVKDPIYKYVPLNKPPEALADRAKEVLNKIGHGTKPRDVAYGFYTDNLALEYLEKADQSAERWDRLSKMRPSPIGFWYRSSPRLLVPPQAQDRVEDGQPPLDISGMARVHLDSEGRLIGLNVVPPEREDEPAVSQTAPPDWSILFADAGLELAQFSPAEPRWTPRSYCDQRAAWTGHYADQPDHDIRVEAGSYLGKPTYFRIITPWTRASLMEEKPVEPGQRAAGIFALSLFFLMLLACVLIARRNLRLRRGDRAGANRFAMVFFVALLLSWLLSITHIPDLFPEFERLLAFTSFPLLAAATLWLLYIALEPYVRRHWPQVLISWTRLLAGRFRDPLVGRDLLIGGVLCVIVQLWLPLSRLCSAWFGHPPAQPAAWLGPTMLGGRYALAELLSPSFIWFTLFVLFMLLILRLLLRKKWLAVVVLGLILTIPVAVSSTEPQAILSAVFLGAANLVVSVALIRFGLLALVSCFFFSGLLWRFPLTTDLSAWYAGPMLLSIGVALVVAGYAFHTSLAGRPLFKDPLLES